MLEQIGDENETGESFALSWPREPGLRHLAWVDRQQVIGAVRSLMRWWGWLGPLNELSVENKLLLSHLLDANELAPLGRHWARRGNRTTAHQPPLGDAPDWTTKTSGFKRLIDREPPTADPWRLFPDWFRPALLEPPGDEPLKARQVKFIHALQSPPSFWMRAQGPNADRAWDDLRTSGVKPWVHRRLAHAARLDNEVEVARLNLFERCVIEVHDLSSQLVGLCCEPQPGERWWMPHVERPQEALHLAALMNGRGTVVASHERANPLRALALHAKRTPFRNLTTKLWDAKHVVGKAGTHDGVLVTPPSTAIGLWRRLPELRWLIGPAAFKSYPDHQLAMLSAATRAVKPAGLLLYAVPTLTRAETVDVVRRFGEAHPTFALKPFAHPITGEVNDGTYCVWPESGDIDPWFIARWVSRAKPASSIRKKNDRQAGGDQAN
jgi:16S rRNA (cytosine967-C5)-methyltransferase